MAERVKRDLDTRESEEHEMTWKPSSLLPTPEPKDGLVFRWVRSSILGNSDTVNMSSKFREGWTPVNGSEFPELKAINDIDSRFDKGIEIGGLVLCQAPAKLMEQKKAYQARQAGAQLDAVDRNFMREGDSRMPLLPPERQSRVSKFGS